ncbi:MAG: hypothetical protein EOP84_14090 [Verrucomicrobiaceae bacterium]|nr:MAG: hypothetical protein EOP84_14090 [Verrucomicrobiaceae bacterium]
MFRSYVPLKMARQRYLCVVQVHLTSNGTSYEITRWLATCGLKGSYRVDNGFDQPWVGDLRERPIKYMFSNEDAAFAFKMRWG